MVVHVGRDSEGAGSGSPSSRTGLLTRGNTGGMLGHEFGHQATRTRALEADRATCSTSIADQYHQNPMGTFENQLKSMEIIKEQSEVMVFTNFV